MAYIWYTTKKILQPLPPTPPPPTIWGSRSPRSFRKRSSQKRLPLIVRSSPVTSIHHREFLARAILYNSGRKCKDRLGLLRMNTRYMHHLKQKKSAQPLSAFREVLKQGIWHGIAWERERSRNRTGWEGRQRVAGAGVGTVKEQNRVGG